MFQIQTGWTTLFQDMVVDTLIIAAATLKADAYMGSYMTLYHSIDQIQWKIYSNVTLSLEEGNPCCLLIVAYI